ncbi:MAG: hypothetical protein IPO58_00495 [Betaproteobacteria bacterium]|nr:hypothetical protein [Betaproteobacteria bacterium]
MREDRDQVRVRRRVPTGVGGERRDAGPVRDLSVQDHRCRPDDAGAQRRQACAQEQAGQAAAARGMQRRHGNEQRKQGEQRRLQRRDRCGREQRRGRHEHDLRRLAVRSRHNGIGAATSGGDYGQPQRRCVAEQGKGDVGFDRGRPAAAVAEADRPAAGVDAGGCTERSAGAYLLRDAAHRGAGGCGSHGRRQQLFDAGKGALHRRYGTSGGRIGVGVEQDGVRRGRRESGRRHAEPERDGALPDNACE